MPQSPCDKRRQLFPEPGPGAKVSPDSQVSLLPGGILDLILKHSGQGKRMAHRWRAQDQGHRWGKPFPHEIKQIPQPCKPVEVGNGPHCHP